MTCCLLGIHPAVRHDGRSSSASENSPCRRCAGQSHRHGRRRSVRDAQGSIVHRLSCMHAWADVAKAQDLAGLPASDPPPAVLHLAVPAYRRNWQAERDIKVKKDSHPLLSPSCPRLRGGTALWTRTILPGAGSRRSKHRDVRAPRDVSRSRLSGHHGVHSAEPCCSCQPRHAYLA